MRHTQRNEGCNNFMDDCQNDAHVELCHVGLVGSVGVETMRAYLMRGESVTLVEILKVQTTDIKYI